MAVAVSNLLMNTIRATFKPPPPTPDPAAMQLPMNKIAEVTKSRQWKGLKRSLCVHTPYFCVWFVLMGSASHNDVVLIPFVLHRYNGSRFSLHSVSVRQ